LKKADSEYVSVQKVFGINTLIAFTNRKNAYRLLSQTGADRTKGATALNVFREYMTVETDPLKKSKAQMELALTLQESGESELAAAEFKKILESDPNNVDALAGVGLNLVNVGYANPEPHKGQQQLDEAARYLQQYMSIAPETHKFKQEAQGIIESIRETKNPPKYTVKQDNSGKKLRGISVSQASIADPNSVK
jgi:tetratricopeptide (TPR) repeat protein